MIIAETRLKKIPEKCTKCKFGENAYYQDGMYQQVYERRCCITGLEIPYVFNKEKRNWEYTKPTYCPLKEEQK